MSNGWLVQSKSTIIGVTRRLHHIERTRERLQELCTFNAVIIIIIILYSLVHQFIHHFSKDKTIGLDPY